MLSGLLRRTGTTGTTILGTATFLISRRIHTESRSERRVREVLQEGLVDTTHVLVRDISEGCGTMFEVLVVSKDFQGLSVVAQHRRVNQLLTEELKSMHGLTIRTMTPEKWQERIDR